MHVNFALEPLRCWGMVPGSAEVVADVRAGLEKLAIARHGRDIQPLLRQAVAQGPNGMFMLGTRASLLGLDEDEARGWLWVAGSLGSPEACEAVATCLKVDALCAAENSAQLLIEAAAAWVYQAALAGEKMGRFQELREQEARDEEATSDQPVQNVADPEGIAQRAHNARPVPVEPTAAPVPESQPGMVVLSSIGDSESREGTEMSKRFGRYVDRNLPWKARLPAAGVVRQAIVGRWPWAEAAAKALESQFAVLRARPSAVGVSLSPLLLVGEPGCGKSSMASHLLEMLGMNFAVVPCGGSHDGGGLSPITRGWTTARPSLVATTMFEGNVCNPGFVLDEIDKASKAGSTNGSVMATLLSLVLAPSYVDSCLMSSVNISGVSFIATANSLKDIDPALRDRFDIVYVQQPRDEDLPRILSNVRLDFAAKHTIPASRLPYLGPVEYAYIERKFEATRSARAVSVAYGHLMGNLLSEQEMAGPAPEPSMLN